MRLTAFRVWRERFRNRVEGVGTAGRIACQFHIDDLPCALTEKKLPRFMKNDLIRPMFPDVK